MISIACHSLPDKKGITSEKGMWFWGSMYLFEFVYTNHELVIDFHNPI